MSEWLQLVITMSAACAVVLTVTLLSHRRRAARVAQGSGEEHHTEIPDVLEYMTMMVAVVYAIVLGLAIAGVWEARSSSQDDVRREAQALYEIGRRVEVLPLASRERIRADIDRYVAHVVHEEWPRMIDGQEFPERGRELLNGLRARLAQRDPTNDLEAQAYQPVLDQVALVDELRTAREQNAGATLPSVVWFGLLVGAVTTVGFIFAMRIGRSYRELLFACLLSALITFLLYLVWDFDAPFGRSGSGSAEPFRQLFPGAL
ncbi:DUF4239 domain-containing protein [Streptomyces sp. NPDC127068]|uniref:bestrophin-like domain n=1 Tax=Streptomyces sp. NPDC127068 TaxID=3347127 RepID=UPI00364E3B77